ncbi:discoidin domain-containing protein [Flavivirga eckloniae]|uniref:F5/8 type C domain-containing protein n=1 Tax=Flavivirga eckloniae TaxID=1803846 RepID=A0A2K9PV57_9FLAO|nr:discoidin domain-containing protein [Flavivirga eckloniae]AUP80955.1 hypothetical protein C1H87_20470 [Flavivirga eckloniae]
MMINLKLNLAKKTRLTLITVLLVSVCYYQSHGQELYELMQEENVKVKKIERQGNRYYKNREKGKGSGYKLYRRNLYWAKRNADVKGRVISDAQVVKECESFKKLNKANSSPTAKNIEKSSSGWKELGPFSWTRTRSWNPGLGRIVSIAVEPTQQDIIYAGSPGGGIWKSTDAGKNWQPLGDSMTNMSIWAIAIDPNNTNTVFLGNSAGQIMKSTNGGDSWSVIRSVNGTPRSILISPNSETIFVGTTRALYRSQNGGGSFSRVLNDGAEDVAFKPGSTNTVYACGDSFYRSTNGGSSFNRITRGIARTERMKMAVTPANPDAVYLVQKYESSFGYLYRSLNGGQSFTVRADYSTVSTNEVYFTQASRDMAIAVSDTNADEVHVGGMNYSRSLDGGVSFTTLAGWNTPNDRSYVHADIEVLQYINGSIYVGSDGGIFRSTNRGNNVTDLTQNGLAVRQYYRIGGAATDANMIVGGAQDNGTNIMNGTSRQFKEWLGADGMECFIDHKNKNVVYGTTQNGKLYKSNDGGNSIGSINKPGNFSGEWVTPFMGDPVNNRTIYVGYSNLYRSRNGGSSWSNITSRINVGGRLDEMAVAASNNNYIYIAEDDRVWRTKNGQADSPQWTEVSNFRGRVNFITVDPNDPERVAIATSGSRVYESTNAGNTWTNIRGELPNISAQCLVYDDTEANGLYLGMQSGVYYTNNNLDKWVSFSKNLPGVQTTDLEIHYATRKLRVATYGRGIWESDLYEEDGTGTTITPPSDLVATVDGKNVTLTWKDNSDNEKGFAIQRSSGGAYERIGYVDSETTYTDENLANGTHSYRVRAYDDSEYSDFSNIVEVKIGDIVTPPDVSEDCIGCKVYRTNSEELKNEKQGKENAADGDLNTYWHTQWYDGSPSHPHYINIDFGKMKDLVGFSYTGRQEGTTGMIKDYEFMGWDGNNWKQLSAGTFQKSTLKQTVEFDKFRCRYVKFRALSEVDGKKWASVAELVVRYIPEENAPSLEEPAAIEEITPEVDLNDFSGMRVFPVPFTNEINIAGVTSKKAIRSVRLIGIDGKVEKIKTSTKSNNILTISTGNLSSGFYMLSFEEEGKTKTIKVYKK